MRASFGSRLTTAVSLRGPLCVGIDPHPGLITAWGLPDDPGGLERFALTCVEAFAGEIAVLKPQSAFFERHGSKGIAVLERVIAESQQAGAVVLLDVKRGDIGSTMAAYADAYLADGSPLAADAVTLSPYLGVGSLEPAFEAAEKSGRGVFVLALTSNPEASEVQRAVNGGRATAQTVVDLAAERNIGVTPIGGIGVVVGATIKDLGVDLSTLNGPVLAPGFGAQGGTLSDIRTLFGKSLRNVLPATSRGVLQAGPDVFALRSEALRTRDAIVSAAGDH
ncbi:orotidine-5'-phosphate decarboxylase [Actinocrispum wychmicini]|uniref:Orotidine 5'-phosphate decarboxylase n=1 Tax=Actinocrispum wychmicini TaxID=1213861 RepID=A0A4R2IY11_9PSEU|nr:orotidine-5'-phosphate decarboxylase [Actinocrispum wychmicini]TCO49892.1 orotidine-5'-phosphate decarboxylase [Actinocrispum wychmicini]